MSINISNTIYTIQFKKLNFIALPELLQQLNQEDRDKSHAAIIIVFIHPSEVLADNM